MEGPGNQMVTTQTSLFTTLTHAKHTHTHGHTCRDTLNKQIVCRNVSTVLFNLLNKQTNKHHVYQLSKLKQGFAVNSLHTLLTI